jgi:phosphate transport system permease protein
VSPPVVPSPPVGSQPLPPLLDDPGHPRAPRVRRRSHGFPFRSLPASLPALIPLGILVAIVVELVLASGFANFGLDFFSGTWTPQGTSSHWGIMVFIAGSFLTAIPALLIAMVVGLGIAIASTTYLPRFVSRFLDPFVDLLAGIPSVIYGIWGYLLVAPYFGGTINPAVYAHLGWLNIPAIHLGPLNFAGVSLFGGTPPPSGGIGLPVTIFILMLMALPITTLLIRDALRAVPRDLWESGLALGATRWETVRRVAIPYASRGILSAGFLGFGRAFGETVAVAMVLGVVSRYPVNVYGVSATMASEMFVSLDSAFSNAQFLSALSEMAIVLLVISLVVNLIGRLLIRRIVTYEIPGL